MGHIEFDTGGILSMPSEGGENPEALRQKLVNLGKKNEQKNVLPSTPNDCLGDTTYLQHLTPTGVEPLEVVVDGMEVVVDGMTEELAAAGAVPGDDVLIGG